MIVQRGSAFWAIDILRDNGSVVPPGEILEALEQVMKAPLSADTPPVGVLTTMNRDKWAAARAELVKVGENEAKMKMIDSALFALTLEDHQPEGWIDQQNTMLHGAGRNRWFDKSFQLVGASVNQVSRCGYPAWEPPPVIRALTFVDRFFRWAGCKF